MSGEVDIKEMQPSKKATRVASERIGVTVLDVVADLRQDVASLEFPLAISGARQARERKDLLLAQLDDHLLPRLAELSTPAIVVIAGSTGAGKSTIANSLVGQELSKASVLRPTTREPLMIFHPQDEELLAKNPLRADLRAVADENVPRGIVLLDAPDLDSLRDENRHTAQRLLEAADLWLFVTTSQRYGDALPWKTLVSAGERGTSVAMVLNRAPHESLHTVRTDLVERLRANDLGAIPLFVIEDQGPHDGLLGRSTVAPIKSWLTSLAGADRASAIIVRTLKGALAGLSPRVSQLLAATEKQYEAADYLKETARSSLIDVVESTRRAVASGELSKGAVEARWFEVAASAKLAKLVSKQGYARGSERKGKRREAELSQLTQDCQESVTQYLDGVRHLAHARVRAAVMGEPGGEIVEQLYKAPESLDHAFAADWLVRTRHEVEQAVGSAGVQGQKALQALGLGGLEALVSAAVLGVGPATVLLHSVLGNAGAQLVTQEVMHLSNAFDARIEDEYFGFAAAMDALGVRKGTELGTRVRLAELKRLR